MKYRAPKGTRDLLPKEKILKNYVIDTLRKNFEKYGFNPLETPVIEMYETCTAKFAAGEGTDVLEELFSLEDRAGRKLGLRYELTFPFARVVANNPQLPKPFKRYQIGRVFRNGPIKLGRYREFWQADADIAGVKDFKGELELLSMAKEIFEELGLKVKAKISSKKLLNGILTTAGVPKSKLSSAAIAIDKLEKIGEEGVKEELKERKISEKASEKILELIKIRNIEELEKEVNEEGKEGIRELKELFKYLDEIKLNYEFSPELARGLMYYTGTIYEFFLENSEITSSIAAGGRYDKMIAKFGDLKEDIPAVGISFGIDVIIEALKLKGVEMPSSVAKVFVIPIKTFEESYKIALELRKKGIKTDIDLIGRSISKNLEYANKLEIPYVLIVGKKELESGKLTLRDMESGKEEKLSLKEVIKKLKHQQ